jgi:hypothetical protein
MKLMIGEWGQETGDRRLEIGDKKGERLETGEWRQEIDTAGCREEMGTGYKEERRKMGDKRQYL